MWGWSREAAILDSRRNRSRKRLSLAELGRDHLERDLAPERQLLGAVNRTHASAADEGLDLVAGELAPDHRVGAPSHAHPASVCQIRDICNVTRVNDGREGRS